MTAQPDRRRRRIVPIVDARFQLKYTALITSIGVGVTAVMGYFLYHQHRNNTRLLDLDDNLREQVIRGDQIFLLSLFVGVLVMAAVLVVWGLIVTHRISGPLVLVARYLDDIAAGHYPDVRPLRRRDELQEFFGAFEEAVVALKQRDSELLAALEAGGESPEQALATLQATCDSLRRKLGHGPTGAAVDRG